jgi:hypothetical protein
VRIIDLVFLPIVASANILFVLASERSLLAPAESEDMMPTILGNKIIFENPIFKAK